MPLIDVFLKDLMARVKQLILHQREHSWTRTLLPWVRFVHSSNQRLEKLIAFGVHLWRDLFAREEVGVQLCLFDLQTDEAEPIQDFVIASNFHLAETGLPEVRHRQNGIKDHRVEDGPDSFLYDLHPLVRVKILLQIGRIRDPRICHDCGDSAV